MVEGCAGRKLHAILSEFPHRGAAGVSARLAQNIVGRGANQRSIGIQLEDFDPPIAVAGNEEPVVDAIQRPLRWSPDAVPGRPVVGDSSDEGGIPPQILQAQNIAGRLPVFLACRKGCPQNE
jgi:hypothetical protein